MVIAVSNMSLVEFPVMLVFSSGGSSDGEFSFDDPVSSDDAGTDCAPSTVVDTEIPRSSAMSELIISLAC